MAIELKDVADRYQFLEKESRAWATDLEKAMVEAMEACSKIRAMKEELHQAADIVAGKPFLLQTKFGDLKYAPLDQLWSSADAYVDLAASAANAAEYFKDQKDREVENCSGHSSMLQCVRCCSMSGCPSGPSSIDCPDSP